VHRGAVGRSSPLRASGRRVREFAGVAILVRSMRAAHVSAACSRRSSRSASPPLLELRRAEPDIASKPHVRNAIGARLREYPRCGHRKQPPSLLRVDERCGSRWLRDWRRLHGHRVNVRR
jgi:hypothetical protein